HFDQDAPAVGRQQMPRQLDRPLRVHPAPQTTLGVDELERRSSQRALEERRVQILEADADRSQRRTLELCRDSLAIAAKSVDHHGRPYSTVRLGTSPLPPALMAQPLRRAAEASS